MYACMFVMYVYIRVCMHLCVYACIYVCMCAYMYVCIHVIFKLGFEQYGRGNCPSTLQFGGGIVWGVNCPGVEMSVPLAVHTNQMRFQCERVRDPEGRELEELYKKSYAL